jgi:hypothetical protein
MPLLQSEQTSRELGQEMRIYFQFAVEENLHLLRVQVKF